MTNIDLGRAMRKPPADYGPLIDLIGGMRDSILAELRTSVFDELGTMLSRAVAQISVAPANVSLAPAEIIVNVPGEDGEIEAMDRQTLILMKIDDQLRQIRELLAKPVMTEVRRDASDRITQTTASR